ncbi:hypothetical protein ZEAMMB73_Zm00001d019243 [Zea mays]|nr:hypothetical protein ZEAMMB73_Zm00001d019243 [Zea mays]
MPDEDEFDHFYRVVAKKTDMLLSCHLPKPLAVSEEEKAVQEKFKEMANECIDLLVDAMRRIPAEKRRPLFSVFGELYPVFESVRWTAEGGCAKWWMALQIMEKLEIVRKMVSSACGGTPLDRGTVFARKVDLTGVDGQALAGHGLGSNLSVEDVHGFMLFTMNIICLHACCFLILGETNTGGDLRAAPQRLQQRQVGHRWHGLCFHSLLAIVT